MPWRLQQGDCLEVLRGLPTGSLDSLVTDPPAGIGFMGREWDSDKGGRCSWIDWLTAVMQEAFRVLKPGAHGLVWAIPRTSHWTATALEDAGFEVRDVITHHFGSGFPKSQNVGNFVDKIAGLDYAEGAWDGWGTALKPATEHWIMVRKPLAESSIARNVLEHGVGALNIDASRVERAADDVPGWHTSGANGSAGYRAERCPDCIGGVACETCGGTGFLKGTFVIREMSAAEIQERCGEKGRWPTNLVLSHDESCAEGQCSLWCPVMILDEQTGTLKTKGDSGGASRFFPRFHYFAKPSRGEREAGLEALNFRTLNRVNPGGLEHEPRFAPIEVKNNHPTVKGKKLMAWLIKLITPPGGTVLDPFAGSGSTGVAALENDFSFLGIEQDAGYYEIAEARIQCAANAQEFRQMSFEEMECTSSS